MELYTCIRIAACIFLGGLFLANCLGVILFGALADVANPPHAFAIFTIMSGVPVTTLCGGLGIVSANGNMYCHGGIKKSHDLYLLLAGITSTGAVYFWMSMLVSVIFKHSEIVPIAAVSIVYTICGLVCIFKTLQTRSRYPYSGDAEYNHERL